MKKNLLLINKFLLLCKLKNAFMSFIKEFKEFAIKGNVMDMAVGVIIGGAFGEIVDRKSTTHKPLIPSIEV